MIRFIALGGANEVGASCYYLNLDGTGILLDCGTHPQKLGQESLPKFEILNTLNLDFVFISHAHQDHIGALPYLVQKFPHVKIFCTEQTVEIAKLTLHNAVRILSEQLGMDSDIQPYSHDEIDMLLRSIHTIKYEESILLKGLRHNSRHDILVRLFDAGHILGSASIMIDYDEEKIFYTGDINISKQLLMSGAAFPKHKITTLITESTYADTDSKLLGTLNSETKRFVSKTNHALLKGGSVLVPVFSLGKMQEMITNIYFEMESGRLTEANIYTGGLSRDISRVYDLNRYLVKYSMPDFEIKSIPQENYFEITDQNYFRRHPGIVLAASGMMIRRTTSYDYAKFWLRQKDFTIFLVGYMDKETPGYKISNAKKGESISLDGTVPIEIKCEIERFYFPTHSRREELLTIVKKLNPKRIILVHGEPKAHNWLGENILKMYPHIKLHSSEVLKSIYFD